MALLGCPRGPQGCGLRTRCAWGYELALRVARLLPRDIGPLRRCATVRRTGSGSAPRRIIHRDSPQGRQTVDRAVSESLISVLPATGLQPSLSAALLPARRSSLPPSGRADWSPGGRPALQPERATKTPSRSFGPQDPWVAECATLGCRLWPPIRVPGLQAKRRIQLAAESCRPLPAMRPRGLVAKCSCLLPTTGQQTLPHGRQPSSTESNAVQRKATPFDGEPYAALASLPFAGLSWAESDDFSSS